MWLLLVLASLALFVVGVGFASMARGMWRWLGDEWLTTPRDPVIVGGLAVVTTHAADGTTRNVTAYCPRCGGSGVEPEGEK